MGKTKRQIKKFIELFKAEKIRPIIVPTDNSRILDGKIALKDTKLINNGLSLDITKLNYILKYLNPFDYSVNIMENVSAKIQIQNVVIDNDEIVLNGTFVIPKDTIQ